MNEQPIRVFVIEQNSAMRAILDDYIQMQSDIALCGKAESAGKALRLLRRQPTDVVLLDFDSARADGMEFLRALPALQLSPCPRVLVRSTMLHKPVVQELNAVGVEHVLPKDYPLAQLMDRIRFGGAQSTATLSEQCQQRILQHMALLQGSHRLSGFEYLTQALFLLVPQQEQCPRMDEIYETLAQRNNISYSAVESAMRKAVRHIFAQNSPQLQAILAAAHCQTVTHMSNSEFLFLLTSHLRAEGLLGQPMRKEVLQ